MACFICVGESIVFTVGVEKVNTVCAVSVDRSQAQSAVCIGTRCVNTYSKLRIVITIIQAITIDINKGRCTADTTGGYIVVGRLCLDVVGNTVVVTVYIQTINQSIIVSVQINIRIYRSDAKIETESHRNMANPCQWIDP